MRMFADDESILDTTQQLASRAACHVSRLESGFVGRCCCLVLDVLFLAGLFLASPKWLADQW
jgi:hypothetical protein